MKNSLEGFKRQVWASREKNYWSWWQNNENYLDWGTERKKITEKWTEPKGPVGYHQVEQHMHHGSFRSRTERERGAERIFEEIIAQIFPNLMKDMNILSQGTQETPSKMKSKRHTLKHILIKLQ